MWKRVKRIVHLRNFDVEAQAGRVPKKNTKEENREKKGGRRGRMKGWSQGEEKWGGGTTLKQRND